MLLLCVASSTSHSTCSTHTPCLQTMPGRTRSCLLRGATGAPWNGCSRQVTSRPGSSFPESALRQPSRFAWTFCRAWQTWTLPLPRPRPPAVLLHIGGIYPCCSSSMAWSHHARLATAASLKRSTMAMFPCLSGWYGRVAHLFIFCR